MVRVRALTPADASALTALYEEYEWWDDRDVDDVRTALSETEVAVGLFDEDVNDAEETVNDGAEDVLLASARVLTDYTYYAYVFDVIVAADRRGEGLGKQLMEVVTSHPDLQEVTLSLLSRSGLVPFYESAGFYAFGPEMEIPEGGTEELVILYERGAEEGGDDEDGGGVENGGGDEEVT